MKEKTLSKKEIKEINQKLNYNPEILNKKDNVKHYKNELEYYKKDNEVILIKNKELIPSLKLLLKNNFLKKTTCDMGAVKFICNGADIMRPGITELESFEKDEVITIVDEKNKTPLAVCKALYNSEEIQEMKGGKALENLHYVGDEYWNIQ